MSVLNIFKRPRGEKTPDQQSTPDITPETVPSDSKGQAALESGGQINQSRRNSREIMQELHEARKARIREARIKLGDRIKEMVQKFKEHAESTPGKFDDVMAQLLDWTTDGKYRQAALEVAKSNLAETSRRTWERTKSEFQNRVAQPTQEGLRVGRRWAGEKAAEAAKAVSREFQNRVAQPTQERLRQLQDSIQRIREQFANALIERKAASMEAKARQAESQIDRLQDHIDELAELVDRYLNEAEALRMQLKSKIAAMEKIQEVLAEGPTTESE